MTETAGTTVAVVRTTMPSVVNIVGVETPAVVLRGEGMEAADVVVLQKEGATQGGLATVDVAALWLALVRAATATATATAGC